MFPTGYGESICQFAERIHLILSKSQLFLLHNDMAKFIMYQTELPQVFIYGEHNDRLRMPKWAVFYC